MNIYQIINTVISIVVFTLLAFLFTNLINKHKKLSKKNRFKIVGLTVLFTVIILLLLPKFIKNQLVTIMFYAAVVFINSLALSYSVNKKPLKLLKTMKNK